GKILVKALIDTSLKFNTISESLFDKLKEDYGIGDPVENLYGDVIGRDWLWMHEAKISFGYSPKTCVHYAKIVINGMSIPLIKENSNKASSSKNNLSRSETEIDKPDLNLEKFIDIFKKLSIETNLSSSDSESTGSDCNKNNDYFDYSETCPACNGEHKRDDVGGWWSDCDYCGEKTYRLYCNKTFSGIPI
ncbi:7579_t:CDS:2, partial [Racocetra persica]